MEAKTGIAEQIIKEVRGIRMSSRKYVPLHQAHNVMKRLDKERIKYAYEVKNDVYIISATRGPIA